MRITSITLKAGSADPGLVFDFDVPLRVTKMDKAAGQRSGL